MRVRSVVLGVSAAMLAAGMGIAGAGPALADQSATIDCLSSPGLDLVLTAGETLTLDLTNCYSVVASDTVVTTPAEISYECATGSPGTVSTTSYGCLFSNSGPGITRWSVTVSDPVVTGTAASFYPWDSTTAVVVRSVAAQGAGRPIPDWIQGYARASADEVCLDGWKPSWDQWPNGGKGGFTCGRAIPSLG